ncbi:MAG: helix-turn-helix transcriptional regulator [Elusimicrobia bacterium]|nr:helix-turn-helix transcriptional regulator [Elusimicrobiota bacterium]
MITLDAALDDARTRRRLPAPAARRRIRQRVGVTATAVARALGVTPASVTRWETGLRDPAERYLRRYIELLDRLVREAANGEGGGR